MEGSIKKIYLHHKFETFGFFHCILFFVFGVVGLLLHLTVAHSNPIFFPQFSLLCPFVPELLHSTPCQQFGYHRLGHVFIRDNRFQPHRSQQRYEYLPAIALDFGTLCEKQTVICSTGFVFVVIFARFICN